MKNNVAIYTCFYNMVSCLKDMCRNSLVVRLKNMYSYIDQTGKTNMCHFVVCSLTWIPTQNWRGACRGMMTPRLICS